MQSQAPSGALTKIFLGVNGGNSPLASSSAIALAAADQAVSRMSRAAGMRGVTAANLPPFFEAAEELQRPVLGLNIMVCNAIPLRWETIPQEALRCGERR